MLDIRKIRDRFKNFRWQSLSVKLVAGYALVGLFAASLGLYALYQLSVVGGLATEVYDKPLQAINNARSAHSQFLMKDRAVQDWLSQGSTSGDVQEDILSGLDDIEATLGIVDERALSETTSDYVGEAQSQLNRYRQAVQDLSSGNAAAQQALAGARNALMEQFDILAEAAAADGFMFRIEVQDRISTARSFMWTAILLALILSLGVAIFTARSQIRPLARITEALRRLSDGDMAFQAPKLDRGDEIGDLGAALSVFHNNMKENERLRKEQETLARQQEESRLEEQRRIAEQKEAERQQEADERRQEAERRRRLDAVISEFESHAQGLLDEVMAAVNNLEETANTMTAIAEKTNSNSAEVAKSAEEGRENIQSVVAAIEQLSRSAEEIGNHTGRSQSVTEDVREKTSVADTKVKELERAANSIGEVVALIRDIAEQTNLLALNATIEASRAGSAGKGFAVVASEVKALASQTGKATEDITRHIDAIQGSVSSTVEAISTISHTVDEFQEIGSIVASSMEQQVEANHEISRSVKRVSEGTDGISKTMSGVTDGAGKTDAAAGEVLSAARQLGGQAGALRERVESFLNGVRDI